MGGGMKDQGATGLATLTGWMSDRRLLIRAGGCSGGANRILAVSAGVAAVIVLLVMRTAPAAAQGSAPGVATPLIQHVLIAGLALIAVVAVIWGVVCRRRGQVLAALFDSLPSPRLVVDSSGKPIAATSTWKKLLGDTDTPVAALAALAATDGADGKIRFDVLLAAAANMEPARADFQLGLPDMGFVEISVMPLARQSGSVIWRMEDVSERYELERVIRTEQEKLIEFVENAPIGFYSVDRDGRFRYVNSTFCRLARQNRDGADQWECPAPRSAPGPTRQNLCAPFPVSGRRRGRRG